MKPIKALIASILVIAICGIGFTACTTAQQNRAVEAVFIAADAAVAAKTKEGLDNNAAALKGVAAGLEHLKTVEATNTPPPAEVLPEVEVTASK